MLINGKSYRLKDHFKQEKDLKTTFLNDQKVTFLTIAFCIAFLKWH